MTTTIRIKLAEGYSALVTAEPEHRAPSGKVTKWHLLATVCSHAGDVTEELGAAYLPTLGTYPSATKALAAADSASGDTALQALLRMLQDDSAEAAAEAAEARRKAQAVKQADAEARHAAEQALSPTGQPAPEALPAAQPDLHQTVLRLVGSGQCTSTDSLRKALHRGHGLSTTGANGLVKKLVEAGQLVVDKGRVQLAPARAAAAAATEAANVAKGNQQLATLGITPEPAAEAEAGAPTGAQIEAAAQAAAAEREAAAKAKAEAKPPRPPKAAPYAQEGTAEFAALREQMGKVWDEGKGLAAALALLLAARRQGMQRQSAKLATEGFRGLYAAHREPWRAEEAYRPGGRPAKGAPAK